MENIKTIQTFNNPYDLLFEHDFTMSDLFSDYLKSVNDYESLVFTVINFDTVITSDEINGNVYSIESIESFYKESIAAWIRDSNV